MALRYGAAQDSLAPKAARISVLIDPAGIIVRVYEGFDAATHADDVLADLDGH